jgi:hypothetical protein
MDQENVSRTSAAIYEVFAPIEATAFTLEEWQSGQSLMVDYAREGILPGRIKSNSSSEKGHGSENHYRSFTNSTPHCHSLDRLGTGPTSLRGGIFPLVESKDSSLRRLRSE